MVVEGLGSVATVEVVATVVGGLVGDGTGVSGGGGGSVVAGGVWTGEVGSGPGVGAGPVLRGVGATTRR